MALLSHDLNRRLTTLTDAHLNWLEQIACNYTGPNPKGGILSALTEYRRWPEQERCKALAEMRDPNVRVGFADSGVGWSFHYGKLSYTTTGGDRWTSRTFNFPASVYAFTLPSRRRAYVVGDHGMVYRYSIVPVEYRVPNMIDAPMMPAEVQKAAAAPGTAR